MHWVKAIAPPLLELTPEQATVFAPTPEATVVLQLLVVVW